jgi:phospholipase C
MSSITNIVVLMLENRSYDNVLGWLYGAGNAAPYDQAPPGQATLNGLTGNESNVNPYTGDAQTVANAAPNTIGGSGQIYPATAIPAIDPNELFGHMAQQYLGPNGPATTPWDGYQNGTAPMGGFMDDYQSAPQMTSNNIADIMTYLTPAQMPVTAFLANKFGVCDQWFASVPTQTFTNRLFALCAAPQVVSGSPNYSVVDDSDHKVNAFTLRAESSVVDGPSLLQQLDLIAPASSGPQWKIYFHDYSIALMTLPYAAQIAQASGQQNISTFDNSDWGTTVPLQLDNAPGNTFVEDVQNGTLPPFSFIEPRYNMGLPDVPLQRKPNETLPPNCNHPGAETATLLSIILKEPATVDPSNPPIDATGGELLLMTVYNLLRNSSYWDSTLLIITYDEAGGVYDHAAPPVAVPVAMPPVQSPTMKDDAALNFGFNVYGGRVPAIIVSPLVPTGSTIRAYQASFDHASIVKTVWNAFNLSQSPSTIASLTARDAGAPSLMPLLATSAVNDASPFSGTVIASPSAVIIDTSGSGAATGVLLVSAGPKFTLSVTPVENWITAVPIPSTQIAFAPDVYGWTIGYDSNNLPAGGPYYSGSVTVTGANMETPAVTVDVYLYLS